MAGLRHGVAAARWHGCRVFVSSRALLLFAAAVLLLFTDTVPNAEAQRPARAAPPELPQVLVDRRSWHQSLLRDRKLELTLRSATRQVQSGELIQALTQVQQILDRGEDGFVRTEGHELPAGAHRIASQVLSALDADGLKLYESLSGPEAHRLLTEARQRDDLRQVAQVARRFFYTTAGFEATDWLATRWMDRGCPTLAAAFWRRLLDDPIHHTRLRPQQRVKAALCFQRVGQFALARQTLKPLENSSLVIAGRPERPDEWLGRMGLALPGSGDAPEPAVVGNGLDRNGSVDGSAPLLRHPAWSVDLVDEHSRHLEPLLGAWESYQLQNGLPLGTSQFPLVVGEELVFRDYSGLRAIELGSGKMRWRFRCGSSLCADIPAQNASAQEGNPDPGNLSRLLVGNHTLGMLASDGRRVFFIDDLESRWNQQSQGPSALADVAATRRQTNSLVAIDTCAATPLISTALWKAGGAAQPAAGDSAAGGPAGQPGAARLLTGHFFLGPPLPVENRLYAVSEADQALHVSCLKPDSGEVEWTQEICLVSTAIQADQQRYYLACSPAYADGVLVCPTHSGLLVGLEPLTGVLLWAYSYDDPDLVQALGAWPNSVRQMHGHRGYPNLPLIQGGRVVYLPPHSEEIHCVDLHTGKLRWRARRQDQEAAAAVEYAAAATAECVLIVGRLRCRGLSLESGEELWSLPLRSTPSGRGVRLGPTYLLPLVEGTIVNIDVATGRRLGFGLPEPGFHPGNLVAGGRVVVSLGLRGVTAFAQCAARLGEMHPIMLETPMSPEQSLLAAELELGLGQITAGRLRLRQLLETSPQTAEASTAEHLLRELLFSEGSLALESSEDVLHELESLVRTPEQRARFLMERAQQAHAAGDAANVLKSARELVELDLQTPLALPHDPSRTIAPDNWARQLLTVERQTGSDAFLDLEQSIASDLETALRNADVPLLRRLSALYADWPAAEPARLMLSQLLAGQGSYQEAELLLLSARGSLNPRIAGEATRLLAELWEERGVYHEAGLLLNELAARFAEVEVAPGRTGTGYLASYPRDKLSWHAFRRLAPPLWLAGSVRISERRWPNPVLQATYNGSGIQQQAMPRGSTFDLFDKGRGVGGAFALVDRHSGLEFEEPIKVPARYYFPNHLQNSFVNHFFPLGTLGAAHGVSLLDRQITWTTVPAGLTNRSDIVRVGPAGPEFCTFQCRQHLFALDPRDGHLLWHRQDLEGLTGLMIDPSTGLIGDSQVLLLFSNDRAHYTVYDTNTGAELRRGKLDIDRRATRRGFGRRLFHVSGGPGEKCLRIWDPLTDRCLWEEPADRLLDVSLLAGVPQGTKAWSIVHQADELAFVTREGDLRIIDAMTGDVRLDVPISRDHLENLGFLRVYGDQQRYYVNLQRMAAAGEAAPQTSFIMSDATIPVVHVQGDLFGIDRKSQAVLWRRAVGNRSVVQLPDFLLPVSLAVCRIRRGNQQAMQIEVLSNETGDLLATSDSLMSDRLLQVSYERDPGRIELEGARTQITVEFATASDAPQAELLRDIRDIRRR